MREMVKENVEAMAGTFPPRIRRRPSPANVQYYYYYHGGPPSGSEDSGQERQRSDGFDLKIPDAAASDGLAQALTNDDSNAAGPDRIKQQEGESSDILP